MQPSSQRSTGISLTVATLVLLAVGSALAAPPPEALLVVSGETVRNGGLPDRLALPDGVLLRAELEPVFLAEPLDDDVLYLWSAETGAVAPLTDAQLANPLAHATVALYQPTIGLLEAGIVTSGAGTALADTTVELPLAGVGILSDLLAERGSFAVFNRVLLPGSRPSPEPSAVLLLTTGAIMLGALGRRRSRSKR